MPSSKEYLQFILEQLSGLEGVAYKPMMGEYLLYCGGGNWTEDWAEYKYLNFGTGARSAYVRAKGKGGIKFLSRADELLGEVQIDSEGFKNYPFPVKNAEGVSRFGSPLTAEKFHWLISALKPSKIEDFQIITSPKANIRALHLEFCEYYPYSISVR